MIRAGRAGLGPRMNTVSWIVLASLALSACDGGGFSPREASRAGSALDLTAPTGARAVDRDVPAPQVFDVTETGLWDGRPSLGGVWVAHPTARDPERVIIRNTQTGAEVIGALFRRERENPGPRFQISSEAAGALGILAGQPATIQVIALRMERIEPRSAAPAQPAAAVDPETGLPLTGDADLVVAATAAPEAAPRRGLRDLFRRGDAETAAPAELAPLASDPGATVPVVSVPVAALPAAGAPPTPANPQGSVEIIALDPEPEAPRRGLRDLFRRSAPTTGEQPTISQTALAPAAPMAEGAPVVTLPAPLVIAAPVALGAPLAATAMLSSDRTDSRPAPLSDAALIDPERPAASAPQGRGLRDLFRRQPEPQVADTTLIPLPQSVAPVPQAPVATLAPVATPASAPVPTASPLDRPFVQAGIFSQEANATRTQAMLRSAGLPVEIRAGRAGERDFWRVVVGPAPDAATQADHMRRARSAGFADAYAVAR
jgi:rare lipoprotein A